jgi:UDP-N-acetylmuramate dehydrogenase
VGGSADIIIEPESVSQLCSLRHYLKTNDIPSLVIGDTSNLLFSDAGLRAVCIRISRRMAHMKIDGNIVESEAGIWVPLFARKIMQSALTGAEHICGIPGTLGGLICMNGGSKRNGIGSSVLNVTVVDPAGDCLILDVKECGFSYRDSVFLNNKSVIAKAVLKFDFAENSTIVRQKMLEILKERRCKFPYDQPNCGSVFKSNPSMYKEVGSPGEVIERIGLKGLRIGDAIVSKQHANFILNCGKARAYDILCLIQNWVCT